MRIPSAHVRVVHVAGFVMMYQKFAFYLLYMPQAPLAFVYPRTPWTESVSPRAQPRCYDLCQWPGPARELQRALRFPDCKFTLVAFCSGCAWLVLGGDAKPTYVERGLVRAVYPVSFGDLGERATSFLNEGTRRTIPHRLGSLPKGWIAGTR